MAKVNELAVIQSMELEDIKRGIEKMASYGASDLAVKEAVDDIALTVKSVKAAVKELKDAESAAVAEFKRIAKPYIDEGKSVTAYSWDNNYKLALGVGEPVATVDEGALVEQIEKRYGASAVDLWMSISDPAPRVLNADKLAAAVASDPELAELVKGVTTVKPGTTRFAPKAVTKAEQKAHDAGEMDDVLVIG